MDIPILYEDDDVLIVNKPVSLVVNRAESVKVPTVQDWADTKIDSKKWDIQNEEEKVFIDRSGIVHRIDKETSGVLVIAKTPSAFFAIQQQFKERLVHKAYLALVHGAIREKTGTINAPVGRLPWNRERFGVTSEGKESETAYEVRSFHHGPAVKGKREPLTLVVAYPKTGRTHQIRVHFKYINHPLVGDYLYAGRKVSRNDRLWVYRVMLHAWKISFTHPTTGATLAIEAPIPEDMNRILTDGTD